MTPILILVLLLTSTAATAGLGCSSVDVDLAPGETESFLVSGDDPSLELEQGDAEIVDVQRLADGLLAVDVHCLASSPHACRGTLHGCGAERQGRLCSSGNW